MTSTVRFKRASALGSSLIALLVAQAGHAQSVAPANPHDSAEQAVADSGEIIVTAQRREQSLQQVPAAVTVISSAIQQELRITENKNLVTVTPNLRVENPQGSGALPRIFMRGLGTTESSPNGTSAVAIYRDDVVLSNLYLQGLPAFDIQRIEVLRGPQGTLFGKNTTGGLINYISARPTSDLEGFGRASYGSFQTSEAEGAVSGQVMPNLTARFSGYFKDEGGWQKNLIRGGRDGQQTTAAARLQLEFRPTTQLTARLLLEAAHTSGDALSATCREIINPAAPLSPNLPAGRPTCAPRTDTTVNDFPGNLRAGQRAARLFVDWVGDAVSVHSISSYDAGSFYQTNDAEGRSTPSRIGVYNVPKLRQFTQEIRLSGSNPGRFQWVFGGFFLTDSYQGNTTFYGLAGSELGMSGQSTVWNNGGSRAFALFGQAEYEVARNLTLALGARYSWESKHVDVAAFRYVPNTNKDPSLVSDSLSVTTDPNAPYKLRANWGDPSFNAQLQYKFSEDVNAYAKISRGVRAGNFNGAVAFGARPETVGPEKLTSYEIGLKSQLFDRTVTLNLAGFYYDYRDLQLQNIQLIGTSSVTVLTNVSEAYVAGIEAEATLRPAEGLTIGGSFGFLDSQYRDPNQKLANPFTGVQTLTYGNPLQRAPRWTWSALGIYEFPLGSTWRGKISTNWNYRSRAASSPLGYSGDLAKLAISSGVLGSARVSVMPSDNFEITLWVENVANNNSMRGTTFSNLGFAAGQAVTKPRTAGLQARVSF